MHAPADRKQIDRVVDAIASDEIATVDRDTLTAVVEADFHRYSAARASPTSCRCSSARRARPFPQAPRDGRAGVPEHTRRDQPVNRR